MADRKIGFIGAGQMARAMARGFVAAGRIDARDVGASDPEEKAMQGFVETVPEARAYASNVELAEACDVIVLAVKPQKMAGVLRELGPQAKADKLFVSIAAGITLATLAEGLSTDRLVRVMPNTPCLVSQCAAGYCLGAGVTPEDEALVARLLSAVGKAFCLEERLLDAVTGLSGSGPAFVYVIIEALSDGGVRMGLPRDVATTLAAQTVRGAAEMVLATGEHPGVLKDKVASPGGTTIAGLAALEAGGLRSTLLLAVEAAANRSKELGRE